MTEEDGSCRIEIVTWLKEFRPDKSPEQLPAQMKKCFQTLTKIRKDTGGDFAEFDCLTDGISEDPELEKFKIPDAGDDFKRAFLSQWNVYARRSPYKKRR